SLAKSPRALSPRRHVASPPRRLPSHSIPPRNDFRKIFSFVEYMPRPHRSPSGALGVAHTDPTGGVSMLSREAGLGVIVVAGLLARRLVQAQGSPTMLPAAASSLAREASAALTIAKPAVAPVRGDGFRGEALRCA